MLFRSLPAAPVQATAALASAKRQPPLDERRQWRRRAVRSWLLRATCLGAAMLALGVGRLELNGRRFTAGSGSGGGGGGGLPVYHRGPRLSFNQNRFALRRPPPLWRLDNARDAAAEAAAEAWAENAARAEDADGAKAEAGGGGGTGSGGADGGDGWRFGLGIDCGEVESEAWAVAEPPLPLEARLWRGLGLGWLCAENAWACVFPRALSADWCSN